MKVALSLFTVLVLQIHFRQLDCFSAEQVIVKIDTFPNTTEVEQGTTVVLVCRVVGVPYGSELTYNWTCASGSTCNNPSEPSQRGSRRQYNNIVVVDIVKEWDDGDYQCNVSNRSDGVILGSDTHRISVTVGLSIYYKNKADHSGSYFPRNSFVTKLTASSLLNFLNYQIICHNIQSTEAERLWYYGMNSSIVTGSGSGSTYEAPTPGKGYGILRRVEARNPTDMEFYCKRNMMTAWFGMFVDQNTTSLSSIDDLSVTQLTQHSISLNWTSVSGSSGYYISYERLDFSVPVTPTYMRLGGSDSTSVTLNKLTAGTRYMIRVWATDGSGVSQPIEKTVKTEDDIPSPPRLLRKTRDNENGVELNWLPPVNPNGVNTSYEIEYTTNSTFTTISGTVLTQNSLTHYNWTGPEFPTHYMRVRAVNSANTDTGTMSEPSNVLEICLGTERAPDKPTEFREITEQATATSVYIEWDESPPTTCDGVTWYELSYTMDKTFTLNVTNITTNNTHYNLTGLVEDATYYITLVAVNAVKKSKFVEHTLNSHETPTISTQPSSKSNSATGPDGAAIVGAVVGVILLATLIVIVIMIVLIINRRRRKADLPISHPYDEVAAVTIAETSLKSEPIALPLTSVKSGLSGSAQCLLDDEGGANEAGQSTPVMSHKFPKATLSESYEESVDGPLSVDQYLGHASSMFQKGKNAFNAEFSHIKKQTNSLYGASSANASKNRYRNINPYDFSRVVLLEPTSDGSDYVNASFIDGYNTENCYIAAQGPSPNSINGFCQMIWEQKPPMVIMLTKFTEGTKRKCEEYFALVAGEVRTIDNLTISTTNVKHCIDFDIREMEISKNGVSHSFEHYFFTGWPDYGVPQYPTTLLRMLYHIRGSRAQDSLLFVHCSAGVGRTGTFIALDYILDQINAEQTVDIKGVVEKMRQKRMFMVQTVEQYMFIHRAVRELLLCGDTTIKNVDLKSAVNQMKARRQGEKETGFVKQFKLLNTLREESDDLKKVVTDLDKVRYKDRLPVSGKHMFAPDFENRTVSMINASLVDGYYAPRAFIAAQTPMQNTVLDFFSLVKHRKITDVIILCSLKENNQETCYSFWPSESNSSTRFGNLTVTLTDLVADQGDGFRTHHLTFQYGTEVTFEASFHHMTSWREVVKPDISALLKLSTKIDQSLQDNPDSPILIACNDGLGRSCTFIAIWSLIEQLKTEGQIDVLNTVKSIRTQRPGAIPELDQYIMIHELLAEYSEAFEGYSNFAF